MKRTAVRRWWWIGGVVFLLIVATLGGGALAITHRPSWYRPGAVNWALLREDKAALAAMADQISAALNSGRPAHVRIEQAQLNRWLNGRSEFWPEDPLDLGPFESPQVRFEQDLVEAAALLSRHGVGTVVSGSGRVAVTREEVRLENVSVRLGAVPVGSAKLNEWLQANVPAEYAGQVRYSAGTVAARNEWVWPNGKRRFRVADVALADGSVEVVLEPLAGGP